MLPGDLIVPTEKKKDLALWRNRLLTDDNDGFVCDVPGTSILLLVEIIQMPKEAWVSDKWKKACHVIAPSGVSGWVGSGWVRKLNDVRTARELRKGR